MGVDREWALGALRMSLGHTSTAADVDRAVDVIVDSVARLRGAASRTAASRPARAR
jgi:cysteine desulfurase